MATSDMASSNPGTIDSQISNMDGDQAMPRHNGELLFEAPWEARAFALAVALNQSGRYPWRDFSAELAQQIAAAEQSGDSAPYYRSWLRSLEALLTAKGMVDSDELEQRAVAVAHADDHRH
jgi:nitrile hydratase accessory protein